MSTAKATPSDPIKRFWDQYIQYLTDKGVKPSVARWYVIRIEHYIEYYKDKRLVTHGPGDVEKYLAKQGQNPKIQDWQFRQVVDAIQNLFAMLNVAWLNNDVGWRYWIDICFLFQALTRLSLGICRQKKHLPDWR